MVPKPSDSLQYRKNRLATFTEGAKIGKTQTLKQWTVGEVDVDTLADSGFYYSPTKSFPNQIACYWCGKKEQNVEESTSITSQHLRTNPKCPYSLIVSNLRLFIMSTDKDTFWPTLMASGSAPKSVIDPQSKESIALRQSTFKNFWKFDSKRRCKVSSKNLSQAGFYYSPVEPGSDRVICMYCDCPLEDWNRNDDPLQEHKNNSFTYCYFLDTIGKDLSTLHVSSNETIPEDKDQSSPENTTSMTTALEDETKYDSDTEHDPRIKQAELSKLIGDTSSPVPQKLENSFKHSPASNDSIMGLLSDSPVPSRENLPSPKPNHQVSLEPDNGFDAFDFSIDDLENQNKGTIFDKKEPQKKYNRKSRKQKTAISLPPKKEVHTVKNDSNMVTESNFALKIGLSSPEPLDFQDTYKMERSSLPGPHNLIQAKYNAQLIKNRDSFILNSELDDPDVEGQIDKNSEITEQEKEKHREEVEHNESEIEDSDYDKKGDDEEMSLSIHANTNSEYALSPETSESKVSDEGESLTLDDSSIVSEITGSGNESFVPSDSKKRKDKGTRKQLTQKRQKTSNDRQTKASTPVPKSQKSLFSDDMDIDQAQLDKILNSPKKGRKMKVLKTTEQISPAPAIFDLSNQNIGDYEESNLSFIEGDVRLPSKSETLKMLGAIKTFRHQEDENTLEANVGPQNVIDINSSPSKEAVLTKTEITEADDDKIERSPSTIIVLASGSKEDPPKSETTANEVTSIEDGKAEQTKNESVNSIHREPDIRPGMIDHGNDQTLPKNGKVDGNIEQNEFQGDEANSALKEVQNTQEPPRSLVFETEINETTTTHSEKAKQNDILKTTVPSVNETFSKDEKEADKKKNTEVDSPMTIKTLSTTNSLVSTIATTKDEDISIPTENREKTPIDTEEVEAIATEPKGLIKNDVDGISSKSLKELLKEELRIELKAQLKEELRTEIHRELLKEELRAEIRKELLQKRTNDYEDNTGQKLSTNDIGNYSSTNQASEYEEQPQQEQQESPKDNPASEVDVTGIQNMTLSPSSYREYVQDLKKMDEQFSKNESELPGKIDSENHGRAEVEPSRIEDSASEQPELLRLSDEEMEEITGEKQISQEIGLSNHSITSPLAQGSTFSNNESAGELQDDGSNDPEVEGQHHALGYTGLESSPQSLSAEKTGASSEQWKDRRLSFGIHFDQSPSPKESEDVSPNKASDLPDIPLVLNRLSVDRVVSEMQALLDTIDYLSEVSATRRELHNDTEGLVTLFVAAMPEEEEFLGVKEWMLHNASTCGRTVREISGKLIAAYEEEFEQLIRQVESMDTID